MTKYKKIIFADAPGSKPGAQNFLRKLAKSDDPLAIVRTLGSHDLLIALNEADDEQRSEILQMVSREQYQGVADLDCWNGATPNLSKIMELMRPLLATDLDGAHLAYSRLDNELKTLLLMKYVIIHVREDKDDEVPANDASELIACSDRFYFIEIPNPDDLPDEIRQIIRGLLHRPFDEYHRELEAIKHDFPSDLEESAYRWRNARLADLGFSSRHESQMIFSPRDPEQVKRMIREAESVPYPLRIEIPLSAIYKENLAGSALLDESLRLLAQSDDPVFTERSTFISAELSALTSLYLTATGCNLGDIEEIAERTNMTRDILSLGLDAVTGGDANEGARAFAYQIPTVIFQAGMGLLIPAKGRALAVLKDPAIADLGKKGALLDAPYAVVLDLLSRSVPMRWPAIDDGMDLSISRLDPLPQELRGFSQISELKSALDLVAEAEQLGQMLFKLGWRSTDRDTEDEILGSTVVLTSLANAFGGGEPIATPVSSNLAADFKAKVLEQDEDSLCEDAFLVLADQLKMDRAVSPGLNLDSSPDKRLLLRLVRIGRRRLADDPAVSLILSR